MIDAFVRFVDADEQIRRGDGGIKEGSSGGDQAHQGEIRA
jgi:hypothetical protein